MSLIIKLFLAFFQRLFPYWKNEEMIVAGVMTGTSVDGIGWFIVSTLLKKIKNMSF